MTRLTDSEWKVLQVLWCGGAQTLGSIFDALTPQTGWSRTTVHTYLKRMGDKGLISADAHSPKRYSAALTQENAAAQERSGILNRVYDGSASNLVSAFVQDGALSQKERDALRRLLDEMEV